MLINLALIQYSEDLIFWSRLGTSVFMLGYLCFRMDLKKDKHYVLGWAFIVVTDLCLVFGDYFYMTLAYLALSLVGFAFLLYSIWKVIELRQLNFWNVFILLLVASFNLYILHILLQGIVPTNDPFLVPSLYTYGIITIVFCMIAGVGYLQLDRSKNEHFIMIPYAFTLSNCFLLVATFTDHYWFYFLSRGFYIVMITILGYQMVKRIQSLQLFNDSTKADKTDLVNN